MLRRTTLILVYLYLSVPNTNGYDCKSGKNNLLCLLFPSSFKAMKKNAMSSMFDGNIGKIETTVASQLKNMAQIESIANSTHQDKVEVRAKRDKSTADKNTQWKDIKIIGEDQEKTQCNYSQCVGICKTIYFAVPLHLAQCYNNICFCFPKKDLYPPVIKNFMKTHSLFGIQQTYE
ncbi:uncharacterized protein CDAR_26111 [Caerostris darwini]|uniref:Uncharacterized protein n=1 Tax=Caerostris darwini TaxID=1538125 RepID=A0AAV4N881_9ARAC|nr:uncharacterized protein CDAR_26111 [Caerostris darwini]